MQRSDLKMQRRQFVKSAAIGLGALASGVGVNRNAAAETATPNESPARPGRPVRAVSIGFRPGLTLDKIAGLVDREGGRGADIIVLPETCCGQNEKSQETLDGPTVTAIARLAEKHRTYIVCPIDRKDGDRRFNSAVLIDRRGQVACVYDKLYPVWQQECVIQPPVQPGASVQVYSTDFGRIGLAICFDVNWSPLWQQMSNQGAELVIWPSAYSAGRSLQAQASQFNYYILSATQVPDCLVYDIDGDLLIHDTENAGSGINVTRVGLDLDRCIFHQDLNLPGKRDALLKKHANDVEQEKWWPMEGWFVLKAKRPGVSARELARQHGLEELRHYINRSRIEIDKCRGWEFS
jgi:predicted amidohydrolase